MMTTTAPFPPPVVAPLQKIQCRNCRNWWPPVFFESVLVSALAKTYARSECIGCRLSRRTKAKQEGARFLEKARHCFLLHARKYKAKGLISDYAEFKKDFGWNIRNMAHDAEHASHNGCSYCRRPYSEMPNGLADLSLDIVHTEELPFYTINTKWCCITCNRSKAKTPAHLWAQKLLCWEQYRQWEEQFGHAIPVWRQISLFEGEQ